MSVTITTPFVNLPVSGVECTYMAAANPLIFNVQRKDYTVLTTSDDGSGNTLVQTSASISDAMNAGDYVYIKSGSIYGVYSVISSPAADQVILNLAFSAGTSGGFLNMLTARPDYKVKAYVYKQVPFSSPAISNLFGVTSFTPSPSGLAQCDLTNYAQGAVNLKEIIDPSAIIDNQADPNISALMYVIFEEFYTGIPTTSPELPIKFQVVNCARQIGEYGGSNLWPFVMEPSGVDYAKFLNEIQKPVRWMGLPFDVQFIYPSTMKTAGAKNFYELQNDVTGTPLAVSTTVIAFSQIYFVQRQQLRSTYAGGASVAQVQCYVGDGTKIFTETLNVDIRHCLPRNPVYIKWIGPRGGWNYWCFEGSNERGVKWSSGDRFDVGQYDLALSRDSGRLMGKVVNPTLVIGANQLTSEQMDGLETLLGSPQVEMLVYRGSLDPTIYQWHTVIVTGDNYKRNVNHSRHLFECTIELPITITQKQ